MNSIKNGQSLKEAAHQSRLNEARILMRSALKEQIAELVRKARPTAFRRTRLKISQLGASCGMEDQVASILDEITPKEAEGLPRAYTVTVRVSNETVRLPVFYTVKHKTVRPLVVGTRSSRSKADT